MILRGDAVTEANKELVELGKVNMSTLHHVRELAEVCLKTGCAT